MLLWSSSISLAQFGVEALAVTRPQTNTQRQRIRLTRPSLQPPPTCRHSPPATRLARAGQAAPRRSSCIAKRSPSHSLQKNRTKRMLPAQQTAHGLCPHQLAPSTVQENQRTVMSPLRPIRVKRPLPNRHPCIQLRTRAASAGISVTRYSMQHGGGHPLP